ncbi:P-loop containing nucleoside triphosphate hydrolase protein [Favolaschia claudopus]|uniref:DNA 3'-5' helicase n=1 Tax=Favolaschia claudopus TaxID=2862362 RepID=A0AAW0ABX6_9AGAR
MPSQHRWTDAQGRQTVQTIVKKLIPQWSNGLYSYQEDVILRVLDGQDVLCCLNTGGGKSAMFSVPLIVLREMTRNPHLYPRLRTRARPVGIVITPTKGLAANIVHELQKLDLPAFAYCHETITQSRKKGENLVKIIADCKTYSLICVDPEHLRDDSWRLITASDTFRANVIFGCVDEAHLINEWGAEFRPLFKHIGAFFRGRLPSTVAILALSATIQPGVETNSICRSLGFSGNNFYHLRLSNERHNLQFIIQPLDHGFSGDEFPELLEYLNQNRKTVVHCRRIEDLQRLFMYAFDSLPPGLDRLRRIKTYHSLHSFDVNTETLRLLDEDPMCQAVFATVAFTNGLNIRSIVDSLAYKFPKTLNLKLQEGGRAGRDPETRARAVTFIQPSVLSDAEKQISGRVDAPKISRKTGKPVRTKKTTPIEHSAALVLSESKCYIATINRIYQNPPLETSTLDCISAKRLLPCSLCAKRKKINIEYAPLPLPTDMTLPPFIAPATPQSAPLTPEEKKLKLTRKERDPVMLALEKFAEDVRRTEQHHPDNHHRPKSSYFPSSMREHLAGKLLALDSLFALRALLTSWNFASTYAGSLYDLVVELQATIRSDREAARVEKNAKQRATRLSKKALQDSEMSEVDDNVEESEHSDVDDDRRSSPIPPPAKRTKTGSGGVLKEVTNRTKLSSGRKESSRGKKSSKTKSQANVAKEKQTLATIAAGFGPAYRTTSDRRRARGG